MAGDGRFGTGGFLVHAIDPWIGSPVVSRSDGSRFASALAVIAVLGLGLRVGYVLVLGPDIAFGFDAIWYQLQAGTVAAGDGYVDPDSYYRLGRLVPTANFPPLWPLLLAAADLLGVEDQRGYQLVGTLVGTATIVVAGLLGRRLLGPTVGLVAAGLVAASPALVASDGAIMSDSLYVLVITLAVLVAVRAVRSPSLGTFVGLGSLVGLATLTRSDALILAPILLGTTAWAAAGPARRRVGWAAAAGATVLVVLTPWIVYASARMDELVLVSNNSGSVFEASNCPGTYSGELIGFFDPACLVVTDAGGDEMQRAREARARGVDYARDHLSELPEVAVVRALRAWGLWDPIDQARLDAIESRDENWQLAAWAYGLALTAGAVPGAALLARRVGREAAPLAAVVVGITVTIVVSLGNPRFVLAAVPCLAVAAAALAVRLVAPGRLGASGRPDEGRLRSAA